MIPVSTLVSGIDNGPIHLGPLKLAWHFKGGGRGAGAASYGAANVPKPWEGGGGRGDGEVGVWWWGGGKVFLACDETEYVLGSDLEHRGILYKYGAYGMESL